MRYGNFINFTQQVILTVGLLTFHAGSSQPEKSIKNAREDVYIHVNSTDLIVGETLHYAVFVYSLQTGRCSGLSSILYLELLNAKGTPVYQTKVRLKEGRGYGEFFLSSLFSTGNYHLVAYTRWMKNFHDFFIQPVTIINPYEKPGLEAQGTDNVELRFYPEGGAIVAGTKNRVIIRSSTSQTKEKTTGRIVSALGEKICDITTNITGFGEFIISPEAGQKYQAIVDKGDGFEFYDLPDVCERCVGLNVKDSPNEYFIRLQSGLGLANRTGIVEIINPQNSVMKRKVDLTSSFPVLKKDLPGGFLKIIVSNESGDVLNERLIFNGKIKKNSGQIFETYSTREKVPIALEVPANSDLSISVSKQYRYNRQNNFSTHLLNAGIVDPEPSAFYEEATLDDIARLLIASQWKYANEDMDSVKFLPEVRSDLVEGSISDFKDSTNMAICLSIPGEDYQIRVTEVDGRGNFTLNYITPQRKSTGFLAIIGDEGTEFPIEIGNEFYDSYPPFVENTIKYDSLRIANVIERSINNQIENAYYLSQSDSLNAKTIPQFAGFKTYRLDDYTRFPTIRDTFIEYILEVGVSKNESDYNFYMKTTDSPFEKAPDFQLLLFLDGVPVSAKEILEFSPYAIEHIEVLNEKYSFGPVILDGIISFHTYNNDLAGFEPKARRIPILEIQDGINRKQLSANNKRGERIPDWRELLYWDPLVNTDSTGIVSFEFFTSDVVGTFEVRIEGVTNDGEPISIKRYFQVE